MTTERTDKEIDEQIDACSPGIYNGSRLPGMSYEEGVRDALHWVNGTTDDKPIEEDPE